MFQKIKQSDNYPNLIAANHLCNVILTGTSEILTDSCVKTIEFSPEKCISAEMAFENLRKNWFKIGNELLLLVDLYEKIGENQKYESSRFPCDPFWLEYENKFIKIFTLYLRYKFSNNYSGKEIQEVIKSANYSDYDKLFSECPETISLWKEFKVKLSSVSIRNSVIISAIAYIERVLSLRIIPESKST